MKPSRICSVLAGKFDSRHSYPWYVRWLDRLSGILFQMGL